MTASLRALLSGVIDYAGLFPPAQLPLEEAIRNYARYRSGPDAWLLGRFICPAARLAELAPFVEELFPTGPPLTVSVLGRGGRTVAEFASGVLSDFTNMAAFRQRHNERASVDAFETRLPDGYHNDEPFSHVESALGGAVVVMDELTTGRWTEVFPFFEASSALLEQFDLEAVARALNHGFPQAGFKLRCGGVHGRDFPTAEHVARALAAGRRWALPMKFTAGLHHPVRHFDAGVQTTMHGFLNVFVAGVLADARALDEGQVREVIADEDAGHFAFDDTGLRWKDWHATPAEIASARAVLVVAFGSCSFDEPCDDLRALGLLK
jgi:hypothetical protein